MDYEDDYIIEDLEEEIIPAIYMIFFESTYGEVVLDSVSNICDLYNLFGKIMDISEKFHLGSNKYICNLARSYAYGKQTGIISKDGKVIIRIDYDYKNGVHFHYENISIGKGKKATKLLIPVSVNHKTYKRIINKANKN